MKVLLTGAGGFIGRRLIERLLERGDAVHALSRSPERLARRLAGLEAAHGWDPLAGPPPEEALEGAEAVVHLAGEPVAGFWTRRKRRAIERSRVEGTRNLVRGLLAGSGGGVLVSASAIGYYGDRGEEELTEDAVPTRDFLSLVCQRWEAAALDAEQGGWRVVTPRLGIVLGPGGGALSSMLPAFRLGLGGRLGDGGQWWSWIHRDDAVEMMLFALDHDHRGAFNATAPEPCRQRDFAAELARQLRRPAALPAPAPLLRLLAGGFSWELLSSKRVLPRRALEAGFRFAHPELRGALAAALRRG